MLGSVLLWSRRGVPCSFFLVNRTRTLQTSEKFWQNLCSIQPTNQNPKPEKAPCFYWSQLLLLQRLLLLFARFKLKEKMISTYKNLVYLPTKPSSSLQVAQIYAFAKLLFFFTDAAAFEKFTKLFTSEDFQTKFRMGIANPEGKQAKEVLKKLIPVLTN